MKHAYDAKNCFSRYSPLGSRSRGMLGGNVIAKPSGTHVNRRYTGAVPVRSPNGRTVAGPDVVGEVDMPQVPMASVLMPAYREQDGIRASLHRVVRALAALPQYTWEIVVVDDGSPDATAEQVGLATAELGLASPSAEDPVATPEIRLVRHVTNQGLGGALRTGFAN